MPRQLVFALVLLVAAVVGGLYYLFASPAPPPPRPVDTTLAPVVPGPEAATETGTVEATGDTAVVREAVAPGHGELLSDPDIRAALCGFKGRVVTHDKQPVADCGVRMYRGAMDSVLQLKGDLFAAEPEQYQPQYIAGEVRTKEDGTFTLTGVWPRGFYLMFAGLGTDAPTHQIITKTPAPGQIVDLGDVVLNDAGVITGTVYGSDGDPMAGALVRAADVPGTLAAFFPVERFDPEGAVLVREKNSPINVVEIPAWVKPAFDNFPIPTTYTASDGTFRLVGVMPGSNMLAVTKKSYLSHVKPSVQVRAGGERDVGKIRMRLGEELYAQVIDEKGEPVPGAEVLAGSTLSMVPFDFAQKLGKADAEGRIDGTGFAPGKVTVAARRSANDPWVVAEPQNIISDVVVTLPAAFSLTVAVVTSEGPSEVEPEFKLLRGELGDGAAEMYLMGVAQPIALDGRITALEEHGFYRIADLPAGEYTLLAQVPGQTVGAAGIRLKDKDENVRIELEAPTVFTVRVVDPQAKPIRNVAIFAEGRGGRRTFDMPLNCGRTDEHGVVTIDKLQAEYLRISADHPKWGVVHGKAEKDKELVLTLQPPGTLRGVLVEDGKAPDPGKFTVAVILRRGDGPRGPLEQVPSLLTAGLDGTFEVSALQPGNYMVMAVKSLDALRSPGGMIAFGQAMFINRHMPSERVDIASGQVTELTLQVGEKPIEGPTAQLTGSVTIDGRAAKGYTLSAYAEGRRFGAIVDDRGRFDLGTVNAGNIWISVMGDESGLFMGPSANVYSTSIELKEGELRELTIDVMTSSIEGFVYKPDGEPAAGARIQANGQLDGEGGSNVWKSTIADNSGRFELDNVAAGVWSLEVNVRDGDERMKTRVEAIKVVGSVPVTGLRIDLKASIVVAGRIDMSAVDEGRQWSYLTFYRLAADDPVTANGRHADSTRVDNETGKFATSDLTEGRYRLEMNVSFESGRKDYQCGVLIVPATGVRDAVLVAQPK